MTSLSDFFWEKTKDKTGGAPLGAHSTPKVSQHIDLVAKDGNLVGSRFDLKRDPTQEAGSPVESMIRVRPPAVSRLEAMSQALALTKMDWNNDGPYDR